MGVDCRIILPDNVRVHDVAKIIGILAGLTPEWVETGEIRFVSVPGVTVETTVEPAMASIELDGKLIDGEAHHYVFYHFEPETGGRLLTPPSTAFWIAMGERLVGFFGGTVDYCDCDDQEVDFRRPAKSREDNAPEDDQDDVYFQARVFNVSPITRKELAECNKFAAYQH